MKPSFLNNRKQWLEAAQANIPAIFKTIRKPIRKIGLELDECAWQGVRVVEGGSLEAGKPQAIASGDGVIFDFGEHLVGRIQFNASSSAGAADAPMRLRLTFGEMPCEVFESFDSYNGWLSRAWLQEEIITLDCVPFNVECPRRYAFRFLKIEHTDSSSPLAVEISDLICMAETSADWERVPLLPDGMPADLKILDVIGLRTLANCMHSVFEDGPKRDRRLWLGDLRLQALANYVTFQNVDLARRCLYLFAGLADDAGAISSDIYEWPTPQRGKNAIVDYTALFIPTLLDYLEATNDEGTAYDLLPVAIHQLQIVMEDVNSEGLFIDPGNKWLFIDWNPDLEKQAAVQGVIIYCARALQHLGELLDVREDVKFAEDVAVKMNEAAMNYLFDDEQNCFISGAGQQISWASQAWMILAEVLENSRSQTVFNNLFENDKALRPMTPYLYHHVVEALFSCGLDERAWALLRSYWGGMVERGADTFWEVFNPEDPFASPYGGHLINSYCHAWSCTPTYFIRKYWK